MSKKSKKACFFEFVSDFVVIMAFFMIIFTVIDYAVNHNYDIGIQATLIYISASFVCASGTMYFRQFPGGK